MFQQSYFKMFSNRFFSFFIILLFFFNPADACETHIALGNSPADCSFTVSYSAGDCYNFNFQQCHYTECVSQDYEGYCYRYESFTSTSYGHCTSMCCDPGVTYDQNWGAINQCQDYLNNWHKIGVIITVVVVLSVVLIFVVSFCCVYHKCCGSGCCCSCDFSQCCQCASQRCKSACQCFRLRKIGEEQSKPSVQDAVVSGTQVEFERATPSPIENVVVVSRRIQFNPVAPPAKFAPLDPPTKIINSGSKASDKWTVEEGKKKGLFMCPICLEGGASFKIYSWFYHKNCAIQQYTKPKEVRRRKSIDVRIYCLKCTTSYFCSTLEEVMKLKSKKELICGKCQDSVGRKAGEKE